ncbi:putative O-methyltransferase [Pseudovirgaria hyperparasitica]|uniref:catechol O-methyltransferase n=1 Tax=Pseudovirgaria hyperparasitica TaxID=470096 RepID=A0A6A6VYN4_9PEZI|nr:putative O-methyltransferase [Pseudovirgaria hyperparasitica]KAF2754969.1 putative O-methyltransferase [Pseudovirgaria hyperparasitica]
MAEDPTETQKTHHVLDRSQQPHHCAIEEYATHHLNSQSPRLNDQLKFALDNCKLHKVPNWTAIPSQGKFLMLQCRMLAVQHVLEVGTFGGHSAIWCAAAHENIKVTTIEMDKHLAEIAQQNLLAAGLLDRVELIVGRAQDVLPKLGADIQAGKRQPFGLFSVDLDTMEQTWEVLDIGLALCLGRACIVAHCAVRLCDPLIPTADEHVARVRGSRELIERVGADPRLDAVLLMTVGEQYYDMVIAAVR